MWNACANVIEWVVVAAVVAEAIEIKIVIISILSAFKCTIWGRTKHPASWDSIKAQAGWSALSMLWKGIRWMELWPDGLQYCF